MGRTFSAILKIPQLSDIEEYNRDDASIIYLGEVLEAEDALDFNIIYLDEVCMQLRREIGDKLDLHNDPRGICYFESELEPNGQNYKELITELNSGQWGLGQEKRKPPSELEVEKEYHVSPWEGIGWGPVVGNDHIPVRYTQSAPGSFEEKTYQIILKSLEKGHTINEAIHTGQSVSQKILWNIHSLEQANLSIKKSIKELTTIMGEEFANKYKEEAQEQVQRQNNRHDFYDL